MANLIDVLFGCSHKRTTFPITAKGGRRLTPAQVTGTYVVCLDCGREFPYDWKEMKLVSSSSPKAKAVAAVAAKAA